jgi:SAM-dependent methyltransferase
MLEDATYRDGQVESGVLCSATGERWPIRSGIAMLRPHAAPWNGAQLINRIPAAAWGYERLWRPYALSLISGRNFPLDEEVALMIEHLAPRRGGVFLDLACSNGLYARSLARHLPDDQSLVVAIDHSLPMLIEMQRRARAEGLIISAIQGLADELPFHTEGVDGVACGGSFNEFTNADRVLSEVRRVLHPDGRSWWMLAQQATTRAGRWLQRGMRPGGVSFPPAKRLLDSLNAAGLRITYTQQIGALHLVATRGRIIALPS